MVVPRGGAGSGCGGGPPRVAEEKSPERGLWRVTSCMKKSRSSDPANSIRPIARRQAGLHGNLVVYRAVGKKRGLNPIAEKRCFHRGRTSRKIGPVRRSSWLPASGGAVSLEVGSWVARDVGVRRYVSCLCSRGVLHEGVGTMFPSGPFAAMASLGTPRGDSLWLGSSASPWTNIRSDPHPRNFCPIALQ